MEYTDSNRSNNVDGKFSLNCYENSYNSYDNNTIPNFNCNFAQNRKFEIKSLSNKKNYNSENFSFYNNNLNNIQFNNLNSSFSNKNDGIFWGKVRNHIFLNFLSLQASENYNLVN